MKITVAIYDFFSNGAICFFSYEYVIFVNFCLYTRTYYESNLFRNFTPPRLADYTRWRALDGSVREYEYNDYV